MAKVAILGSGDVGKALAKGFTKHGHEVRIGSREGNKLGAWSAETGILEGRFGEILDGASIVVLAVGGSVAEGLVASVAEGLRGKVVLDATNPIGGAPVNGILPFFTGPNDSLMERLQKAVPEARFVKAFSSVGHAFMVDPAFGTRPTMFIAGNDAEAKRITTEILNDFGWDAEDIGGVEGARAIEPLCQLWCAPGLLRNQWTHAFKLLKL